MIFRLLFSTSFNLNSVVNLGVRLKVSILEALYNLLNRIGFLYKYVYVCLYVCLSYWLKLKVKFVVTLRLAAVINWIFFGYPFPWYVLVIDFLILVSTVSCRHRKKFCLKIGLEKFSFNLLLGSWKNHPHVVYRCLQHRSSSLDLYSKAINPLGVWIQVKFLELCGTQNGLVCFLENRQLWPWNSPIYDIFCPVSAF